MEHKTCSLISLQHASKIFLIVRRIQRDVIVNLRGYSCKASIMLLRF